MKKQRPFSPAGFSYTIMRQVCNLIPPHLVNRLAAVYGVNQRSRDFTPWSHVVSLLYAQMTHAVSLNDVCDGLRMNETMLTPIRGASAPAKNTLSHANRERSCAMAEALYWEMMDHLTTQSPRFAKGKVRRGYLRRFRAAIHAMDSTTVQLVAQSLDWAKHRRRKAAAKCHLRLNLQSFLPNCVIIDTARFHDTTKARELCAGLQAGEIVVFDKAYVDFDHLAELDAAGVFWVSRPKENLQFRVVKTLQTTENPRVLRDELIELTSYATHRSYPKTLRRVVALVEVDGQDREMVFVTNHLTWSAWTVAELYRCRWDIEVFFKEIKQTVQLADFLGHNANAVRWQIWMGLLTHLLVRYLAFLHSWQHSFTLLFTTASS
jgi:IS5 family transposase